MKPVAFKLWVNCIQLTCTAPPWGCNLVDVSRPNVQAVTALGRTPTGTNAPPPAADVAEGSNVHDSKGVVVMAAWKDGLNEAVVVRPEFGRCSQMGMPE